MQLSSTKTCSSGQKQASCVLRPPWGALQDGAGLGPVRQVVPSGHQDSETVKIYYVRMAR